MHDDTDVGKHKHYLKMLLELLEIVGSKGRGN